MRWDKSTAKIEMSPATVCNCQHNTPDPEGLPAVSSRQSGQQQKTPDGRMCWAGSVVRRAGDAGRKRHRKLVNSGPSDTEELGCAGIGTWVHQACAWLVLERQASEAQCASVVTDHDQISVYHWQLVQPHSTLVAACLLYSLAPQHRLHYSNPRGTTCTHGRVSQPIRSQVIAGCDDVVEARKIPLHKRCWHA